MLQQPALKQRQTGCCSMRLSINSLFINLVDLPPPFYSLAIFWAALISSQEK